LKQQLWARTPDAFAFEFVSAGTLNNGLKQQSETRV